MTVTVLVTIIMTFLVTTTCHVTICNSWNRQKRYIAMASLKEGVIIVLSLAVALCYPFQPQKKDLASIRYRFSPCNTTGRTGPSYESCSDYYSRKSSRLDKNPFTYPQPAKSLFENAQVFNVSRVGLYNITVAGAAGGVGVCNFERGFGLARQVQVELYPGIKLLIVVGQRGLGFCDLQPTSSQCLNRPVNLSQVATCEERWFKYANESVLAMVGGGGGGGASMVRSFSKREFDIDPIAVGAGGGGSPAVLQYEVVDDLGVAVDGLSAEEAYRRFMNAKSKGSGSKQSGGPGLRNSSGSDVAGVGGGYLSTGAVERLDVDGGFLNLTSSDFAVGGVHCGGLPDASAGGFGGGGGGCGGGGGGGGFTGGDLLGEGSTVPGGGGVSYTGSSFLTSFKLIKFVGDTLNTQQDGYVDIINADCECVFQCEVYHEEDKFQCVCPSGTYIAPDSSDCYEETTQIILESSVDQLPPDEDGIIFNYETFTLENRVFLYSVDFAVVLDGMVEEDEPETVYENCIVGFLGENYELVAHTDVHRRSVRRLNTLSPVTSEGSQNLVPFLETPVVVIAGLVVSAGNCSVENMIMHMNVSIRDRQVDYTRNVDSAIPMEVAEELERFTIHLTTSTLSTTVPSNSKIYAVPITVSVLLLAVFIFMAALVLCVRQRRKSSRKVEHVGASDNPLEHFLPTPKTSRRFLLESNSSTKVGRGEDYVLFKCVHEEDC